MRPDITPCNSFSPVLQEEYDAVGIPGEADPTRCDSNEIDPLTIVCHERRYLQQFKIEPTESEDMADENLPRGLELEQMQVERSTTSKNVPIKRELEEELICVESDTEVSDGIDENDEEDNVIECNFGQTKAIIVLNRLITKEERALLEDQLFNKVPVVKLLDEIIPVGNSQELSDASEILLEEDSWSEVINISTLSIVSTSTNDLTSDSNSSSSDLERDTDWYEESQKNQVVSYSPTSYKTNNTRVEPRYKHKTSNSKLDSNLIPNGSRICKHSPPKIKNIHTFDTSTKTDILDSEVLPSLSVTLKSSPTKGNMIDLCKNKTTEMASDIFGSELVSDQTIKLKLSPAKGCNIDTLQNNDAGMADGVNNSKPTPDHGVKLNSSPAKDSNVTVTEVSGTLGATSVNQCLVCKQTFSDATCLDLHSKEHRRLLTCCACGKKCSLSTNLNQHKIHHQAKVNFKCKLCPKLFLSLSQLLLHGKLHYNGDNNEVVCYVCQKSFSYYQKLSDHYNLCHQDGNVHKHKESGDKLGSAKELNLSRMRHKPKDSVAQESLPCPSCDKRFDNFRGLRIHFGVQHRVKPVKLTKSNVSEGSLPCPSCSKQFNTLQGLKIHVGLQHQRKPIKLTNSNPLAIESLTCPVCSKRFTTFQGLKIHFGVRHRI